MNKIKIICVVGPTAAGKTGLGIEIAKRLHGEIISADSMQLYRGLHIASAAPDAAEMQGIPHHLIEFLDRDVSFSVADYVVAARQKISEIDTRGHIPVIVGGTGLYINSLVDNINFAEEKSDTNLREKLETMANEIGMEKMLEKLSEFDKASAKRLHPNNRRRILRAFEVYYTTGKTMTEQNINSKRQESPYDVVLIGITYRDRQKLYERIEKRVDIMAENGLVDEAKASFLSEKPGGGTQAIGHKELFGFFKGECTLNEALENLKKQTRHYAKRQMTWFSKDERIHWIYADEEINPIEEAMKIIN